MVKYARNAISEPRVILPARTSRPPTYQTIRPPEAENQRHDRRERGGCLFDGLRERVASSRSIVESDRTRAAPGRNALTTRMPSSMPESIPACLLLESQ